MKPGTLMAHMTIHGVVILVIGDHAMAKPNGKLRRMTALMLTFLDRQWVLREWNTTDDAWRQAELLTTDAHA